MDELLKKLTSALTEPILLPRDQMVIEEALEPKELFFPKLLVTWFRKLGTEVLVSREGVYGQQYTLKGLQSGDLLRVYFEDDKQPCSLTAEEIIDKKGKGHFSLDVPGKGSLMFSAEDASDLGSQPKLYFTREFLIASALIVLAATNINFTGLLLIVLSVPILFGSFRDDKIYENITFTPLAFTHAEIDEELEGGKALNFVLKVRAAGRSRVFNASHTEAAPSSSTPVEGVSPETSGSLLLDTKEANSGDVPLSRVGEPIEVTLEISKRYIDYCHGKMAAATEKWLYTLKWRKDFAVDNILSQPHFSYDIIKKNFPHFFCGIGKNGYPVYYEKTAMADLETLKKSYGLNVDDVLWHIVYMSEYLYNVIIPDDAARLVTVIDIDGLQFSSFVGDSFDFIIRALQLIQNHYPERAGKKGLIS